MKKRRHPGLAALLTPIILGGCILTALLSSILYGASTIGLTVNLVEEELESRAMSLSRLSSRYLEGNIVRDTFTGFYSAEMEGVSVYLFDDQGSFQSWLAGVEAPDDEVITDVVSNVLVTGQSSSARRISKAVIAVGVPLEDNLRRTIGVLVLVKPATEVREAFIRLVIAASASVVASSLIMAIPAIFLARSTARPLQQMTEKATAMAAGNFDAAIPEEGSLEMVQLAGALNNLSRELDETIGSLTDTQQLLNSVLGGIHDGVLAMDATTGEVLFSNDTANTMFKGKLPDSFREDVMNSVSSAGNADTPAVTEWTFGERTYLVSASILAPASGHRGTVLVLHDMTEAARLENTRREYVANVSHELRTPVASIRSLAETLNDGIVTSEEERFKYYGYILRESTRLTRLINDLLELSRLQSGNVALELNDFDADEVAHSLVERQRIPASYSGVNIAYESTGKLMCHSNEDRFEQVLLALIDNAIKYGEEDSGILVSLGTDGDDLVCSVSNRGNIDEKDLPYLFDRFYKADKSHSGQGTGLGLAIVHEIITLLGGTVSCENRGPDTVFTFSLPR